MKTTCEGSEEAKRSDCGQQKKPPVRETRTLRRSPMSGSELTTLATALMSPARESMSYISAGTREYGD